MRIRVSTAVLLSAVLALYGCGGGSETNGNTGSGTGSGNNAGTQLGGNNGTNTSCEGSISTCFDVGALQVARYKDNKKAAASYTFDDGYSSSSTIASLFESRGLRATFCIVAGNVA